MKLILIIALAMSGLAHADNPCHDVINRAANEKQPDEALTLLGGCLAGPAPLQIHQRVVVEMADLSLRSGDVEMTLRYLETLREMLKYKASEPAKSKAD